MIDPQFLWRIRRTVEVALPVVLAVDVVHSFWYVIKLRQARLQEWREEDELQARGKTHDFLQFVAARCSEKDKAFWPYERPPVLHASDTLATANADAPSPGAVNDTQTSDGSDLWLDVIAHLLNDREDNQTATHTHTTQHMSGTKATAPVSEPPASSSAPNAIVRAGETASEGTLAPPVPTTLGARPSLTSERVTALPSPPAGSNPRLKGESVKELSDEVKSVYQEAWDRYVPQTFTKGCRDLRTGLEVGLARVPALVLNSLQHRYPLPQLQVQRRSALRFRLKWRQQEKPSPGPSPALEVVLDC